MKRIIAFILVVTMLTTSFPLEVIVAKADQMDLMNQIWGILGKIESIGSFAFENCTSLTTLKLPNGV